MHSFGLFLTISVSILGVFSTTDVASKMDLDGIVPDVLDAAPSGKVSLVYPGNKEVNFGAELTPTEVKSQPKVQWEANPDKYYTLSMVDADVPTRENPTWRSINHWLVVNIKGNDLSTGQTVTSYHGSKPRKGHGLHRYIFIVFEQKDKITVTESNLETERKSFSIQNFANKYGLGNGIAINFYKAQWDSSVPETLH